MRIARLIAALILFVLGLYLLADDVYTILRYGCDINDMASIDSQWGPIDWPTGERPSFTVVPVYVYAFGFWLLAALMIVPKWIIGKPYRGRMWRGAE